MGRHGEQFVLYFFVNTVTDCFDMGIGIAFADDEKVCRGIAEFSQVKLDNFFTFLVANTFDDGVIELLQERIAGICPPRCCQIQSC